MQVINLTRDKIGFESSQSKRLISLDFNSADGNPSGVEVVMPYDATLEEFQECRLWALLTSRFFKLLGHTVPLRHGDGIVKNPQRRSRGIIHLEPFFIEDESAVELIQENARWYAGIIAATVGQIPGSTIIPPHTSTDPGATGRSGLSERAFASTTLIPILEEIAVQSAVTWPTAQKSPVVTWTETTV